MSTSKKVITYGSSSGIGLARGKKGELTTISNKSGGKQPKPDQSLYAVTVGRTPTTRR